MSLINHALYDWVAENGWYDLEIVRRPKRPRTGSSCRLMTSGLPIMTTVQEIAQRWGFWHTGEFAADYRRLFGELPSQTFNG